jgi:FkbM family methyltransferase
MSITSGIKRTVHKAFNLLGFDLIKRGHFDQSLGTHLLNVFSSRQIDCVLDVGANIGQYGQFLRGIGYTGYIVSFEPVKSAYDKLVAVSKGDSKWICHNMALGEIAQSQRINVFGDTQFCSFLEASDYSKAMWSDVSSSTKETVQVVRLDDIFSEIKNRVNCGNFYLKLDTQGFDLNVFRGAVESLREIHAMQSELSLISVYDGMEPSFAGLEKYREAGFLISGMFPINIEPSLAVIEYDCVLVKRKV